MKMILQIEFPLDDLEQQNQVLGRLVYAQYVWLCCYRAAMKRFGFRKWYAILNEMGVRPIPTEDEVCHQWHIIIEATISIEPLPLPKHYHPSCQISWDPKQVRYLDYGTCKILPGEPAA